MRLYPAQCAAVAVDYQQKLLPPIQNSARLLCKSAELLEGLTLLSVPVLFTEQYSRGLGATDPLLRALVPDAPVIEKVTFGAGDTPAFCDALKVLRREQILLCGIEAHVCVLQTALDLKAMGYQPVLVADCISSRGEGDYAFALERARQEQILLTSCEALLFELTGSKEHPRFHEISALIKRSELF